MPKLAVRNRFLQLSLIFFCQITLHRQNTVLVQKGPIAAFRFKKKYRSVNVTSNSDGEKRDLKYDSIEVFSETVNRGFELEQGAMERNRKILFFTYSNAFEACVFQSV